MQSERIGLSTLEDITKLILDSHGPDETLRNIVQLVAERMHTEACSIYLYEDGKLTLRATIGLSTDLIGKVKLDIGEGLIGHTAETGGIVNVNEAQQHERFLFVESLNEEIYHSFLGIPLFNQQSLIGVLAIQSIEPRWFSPIEMSALSTIAFQLSTVVASARLLDQIKREQAESNASKLEHLESKQRCSSALALRGQSAFTGFAIGPAVLIRHAFGLSDRLDDESLDIESERERLESALESARIDTICLEKKVADRLSEADASIFHSHLMILQDRVLIDKLLAHVDEGIGAVNAVKTVLADYVTAFRRIDDPYLRERAADLEDIGRRLLAKLLGEESEVVQLHHPAIIVAKELMPSDVASMDHHMILGLVLESEDRNSHAAIISRSLGIPSLFGVKDALQLIDTGASLILDANSGCVHIEPNELIRAEYQRLKADSVRQQEQLLEFKDREARSSDGESVCLRANVGLVSDLELAHRYGAQGVGLYRTEFPYMARTNFPDRQTQYDIYRIVVESFAGESVTIRTLDIGGDKMLPYFEVPEEDNPFLGWRSIRVSLDHRDMFRTQIEAILMASTHGNVKIMFPMVSSMDEVIACKEVVREAKQNLEAEGWTIADVPFGVMIEVPAAVLLANHFASEVDFFALGTNDLVQYMLAADRGNSQIERYYDSLHPAVLQAIAHLVDVAKRHKKGLCICGEMASDPACFAILVGLGLREFSVSSPRILPLKSVLSKLSLTQMQGLAKQVLRESRGSTVRSMVDQMLQEANCLVNASANDDLC